jgi:hypothetical protein
LALKPAKVSDCSEFISKSQAWGGYLFKSFDNCDDELLRGVKMDTMAIANSLISMQADQTRQTITIAIIKQAAVQQNMVANLLEQNPMPKGSNFSTYA